MEIEKPLRVFAVEDGQSSQQAQIHAAVSD
jgi:hypothetical protein